MILRGPFVMGGPTRRDDQTSSMIARTKSLARRGKDGAPRLCLPELGAWRGRADAPAGDDRAVLRDVGGGLQDPSPGDLRTLHPRLKAQHALSGPPHQALTRPRPAGVDQPPNTPLP